MKEFTGMTDGRYTGNEGGSVTMICEARGDPQPVIQWWKVGTNQFFDGGLSTEVWGRWLNISWKEKFLNASSKRKNIKYRNMFYNKQA